MKNFRAPPSPALPAVGISRGTFPKKSPWTPKSVRRGDFGLPPSETTPFRKRPKRGRLRSPLFGNTPGIRALDPRMGFQREGSADPALWALRVGVQGERESKLSPPGAFRGVWGGLFWPQKRSPGKALRKRCPRRDSGKAWSQKRSPRKVLGKRCPQRDLRNKLQRRTAPVI